MTKMVFLPMPFKDNTQVGAPILEEVSPELNRKSLIGKGEVLAS